MAEYRFVTFRQAASKVVPAMNDAVTVLTIDLLGSVPELAEHMDGWEVVNFQIIPVDSDVLLSILLKTEVGLVDGP